MFSIEVPQTQLQVYGLVLNIVPGSSLEIVTSFKVQPIGTPNGRDIYFTQSLVELHLEA